MSAIAAALPRAQPGCIEFAIPGLARVEVRAGAEPAVERDPRAADADVAWLLNGPVEQMRRLLRGEFALHAATVAIDGRAVALVGHAASGKSLVTAALAQREHAVLSDTWLPVSVGDVVMAHPTCDALGLWPAAWKLLDLERDEGALVRPALDKRAFAFRPHAGPVAPLAAVVALRRGTLVEEISVERREGAARAALVKSATALLGLVEPLGLAPQHFLWMAALASNVAVFELVSDRHGREVGGIADAVEALVCEQDGRR